MSIILYHHSQSKEYRNPAGAVLAGTEVRLSLKVRGSSPATSCRLHLWTRQQGDREVSMIQGPAEDESRIFSLSTVISTQPCLCWYYFILKDGDTTLYYGNNMQQSGGEGRQYEQIPPAFQITVHEKESVPLWYRNSIVYQIFPDRFARSDDWMECQHAADHGGEWKGPSRVIQQNWYDIPYYTKNERGEVTRWPFFGGTLQGIRSRLLYLKSMGAGAIYLNPIFTASSNHKYDTADYLDIDPAFGTIEDFRQLAYDARRLGIRLILDGVFNHTGADSIYFNQFGNYPNSGACQGEASPYYNWYRFIRFPDEYDCWWGVGALPNVEESCPDYQDFIFRADNSVIRYWLKNGASGWRLDVADELPDEFISGIRHALKETCPDGLLLGEVWEDASNKVSYGVQRQYLLGDELDSVMNYPFRDLLTDFMLGKCPAEHVVKGLRSLAENYPPQSFYGALNLTGSHDRIRILTLLGDPPEGLSDTEKENYRLPADKLQLARMRLKVLSLIQYVLPGVPCLYYGDEAGVQGFEDPYNRGTYPWGKEDDELLTHYRMLAALRKQYRVLTDGDFSFHHEGEHVFIARRSNEDGDTVIAVVNRNLFGGTELSLELPKQAAYVLELLSSEEQDDRVIASGGMSLNMPPLSAKLFYCSRKKPQRLCLSRSAGILCHVSSLPSGKLDSQAEKFIDYLVSAGQKIWQILPLNPVEDWSLSPYSSPAVFAGNTRLSGSTQEIDPVDYANFCNEEAFWLEDYALYEILKNEFHNLPWQQWPEPERRRKNLDYWRQKRQTELEAVKKEQFLFWQRWKQVKTYANSKGISIVGDLPVYVAKDSADTWANSEVFLLDGDGHPLAEAGVPPDYFNEEGQHWGNPLYDWDFLKQSGYRWWLERISRSIDRFDYIRLDHFRSFSAFYAIPAGKTPKNGWWLPGPGKEFFDFLADKLGTLPFLAEDLGFLDAQVHSLLKLTGYPGMMVYQFSAEEMKHISAEKAASRIFYSGTHDNQTLYSWCRETSGQEPDDVQEPDTIIQCLYQSPAPWVIIPLQDLLGLGDESRMNVPGQAKGNWSWQAQAAMLTSDLADKLQRLVWKSER